MPCARGRSWPRWRCSSFLLPYKLWSPRLGSAASAAHPCHDGLDCAAQRLKHLVDRPAGIDGDEAVLVGLSAQLGQQVRLVLDETMKDVLAGQIVLARTSFIVSSSTR